VAYHDRTQGDCKVATETTPGSFSISFVDGNNPTTDVGQFVTARAAPDGTVHVAYVDAVTDRLLYKPVKSGVAPAGPEIIDDGMRPDGPHPVGSGAALWTDGTTVKVAYQDQLLSDLMLATRTGGSWTRGPATMGAPGFGFYPKIVSDGNKLYVAQFVYNRNPAQADAPLGSLQIAALP
jgi:hypothetical protein